MNRFLGRYNEGTLKPEDPVDYRALENQDPQVLSVTFYRNPRELPARRLGVRLEQTEDDGGDVRVAELALTEDSILLPSMPIQVGDILVAVNNQACYGKTFGDLKKEALAKTGLITMHFRKTDRAPIQDEIRQAIFIEPKAHTCLLMAVDLQRQNGTLTVAAIDPFNDWLANSCLARGQAVLTMNGASSFQLEEEDAQLFLQTQAEINSFLSIKTYAPSRAGAAKPQAVHEDQEPNVGLACYIAHEEQTMNKQVAEALEDTTVDKMGDFNVYTTSTKLFVYIKGSISRCASVTKGKAFFLLCHAFQNVLADYAQVQSSRLPPPTPKGSPLKRLSLRKGLLSKKEARGELEDLSFRVSPHEEDKICYVISTCEYCADRVQALQHIIRDTIDDEYKLRVNLAETQEIFHGITVKAIHILVSGLENRLEPAFKMMKSISWASFEDVNEESRYVVQIYNEIPPYLATARQLLPTSYFRSVCDKFAMTFTEAYYDILVEVNHISPTGIQQLLLDVYNLKTLFLKLPLMAKSIATPHQSRTMNVPAMYTEIVNFQFQRIETLLKLGLTHDNMHIVHDEIEHSQVFTNLPGVGSAFYKSKRTQQPASPERQATTRGSNFDEPKASSNDNKALETQASSEEEVAAETNQAEEWRSRNLADQI